VGFLGKSVSFEIKSDESSKVLNLLGEGGKAESRMTCSMYTEEECASLSSSEDGSAIIEVEKLIEVEFPSDGIIVFVS
jgi:hypothetical protein